MLAPSSTDDSSSYGKRSRVLFDDEELSEYDSDYELKKSKIQNERELVILILNDNQNIDCTAFQLLKTKFAKQQLGKKSWLENRELKYEHISIEFAKDKQFLIKYAQIINSFNSATGLRKRFKMRCWDEIGDELKDDIDIIVNFALYDEQYQRSSCYEHDYIDIIEKHCQDNERLGMEVVSKFVNSRFTLILEQVLHRKVTLVKRLFSFTKKLSTNANLLLEYIKLDHAIFLFADEALRNDKNFVLQALEENNEVYTHLNEQKLSDKEIVLQIIRTGSNHDHTRIKNRGVRHTHIKNDREIILEFAKKRFDFLEFSDDKDYKHDRHFALELVRHYGDLLKHFSDDIKNDREIVLQAVKSGASISLVASTELQQDREIVLQAIKNGESISLAASTELRQDREIMLEATKHDMHVIIGSNFEEDRELVLEAVKQNGKVLKYIGEEFINDREILLQAIISSPKILKHVSCDREIILEAVKINGEVLEYVNDDFKNDRDIVIAAIQNTFGNGLTF